MSNHQGNQGPKGSQWQRDVKPGDEQDRQRERQESNDKSAEQPGSAADKSKEQRRG